VWGVVCISFFFTESESVNVSIACLYIPVFVLSLDIQLKREKVVIPLSRLTLPHMSVYAAST
jgi:uncharacterized membrane protein YGL010W